MIVVTETIDCQGGLSLVVVVVSKSPAHEGPYTLYRPPKLNMPIHLDKQWGFRSQSVLLILSSFNFRIKSHMFSLC